MIHKKLSVKYFAVMLFMLVSSILYGQNIDNWQGIWAGELFMFDAPGDEKVNTIHMELHISKTDSAGIYNWRIIYIDSTKDDRRYLLRTIDESAGKYAIDEKDGILLDVSLLGNKLCSRFAVFSSTLDITYQLESDRIILEVFSGSDTPERTTYGTEEKIPVLSFSVKNYQRAYLFKK